MQQKPEFTAVYYLPPENQTPDAITIRYMLKKADVKDGDKVRLFPKKEVITTGYNSGIWGQNVADHKIEIAAWALGYVEDGLENTRKLLKCLEDSSLAWAEFMDTQVT